MLKHKIFMGFTEIAGYYYNLKRGFDDIGVESHFFPVTPHMFSYNENEYNDITFLEKILRGIIDLRKRLSSKNKIIAALPRLLLKFFLEIIWFLYYVSLFIKYNIFIIGFAEFPFKGFELPLFKLFGKKLICIFHGSDSRPPYIDGAVFVEGIVFSEKKLMNDTLKKRILIDKINKYSDLIIDSPGTSLFHSKEILNFAYVGIPYENNNISKRQYHLNQSVRILHSPSHPIAKGTPFIESIIENLKTKYEIEFIQIIGKPNAVVIEELQKCDFVVDQAYSDTPMAGFATEAAFMGKPAVVGGEFSEFTSKYLRKEDIPPSLYVHPDKMREAIEKMIVDKNFRIELGERAQEFVRKKWARKAVADKIISAIEGKLPDEAYFSPFELVYAGGVGMRAEWRKHVVCSLVKKYGKSALRLDDKPSIRDRIINESHSVESQRLYA